MIEISLLRDSVALGVTFVLTGWLLGLIAVPERLAGIERLFLSLALAVPATLLAASPALVFHGLGAIGVALGVAALGAVAARRSGEPLRRAREAAAAGRQWVAELRWTRGLLIGAGAVAGWLAVAGPQLAAGRVDGFPRSATVWYYWRLVAEALEDGGLPGSIAEWGRREDFPAEYAVTTLHGAATAALAGGADLDLLERYRLAMVVLGLLAAWALWRRWLPAWWAWLASILTLAAAKTSFKFTAYRPETFGVLLVLWSGWLLDEALERRSPRWAALAGIVSASAFLAHAEVWLLTAPLWLGIAASRLLPEILTLRRRASGGAAAPAEASAGRPATAHLRTLLVCGAAFALTATAVSVATTGGGRLAALVGVGGGDGAPRVERGLDPTWQIHAAMYNANKLGTRPPDYCRRPFARPASRFPYSRMNLRTRRTKLVLGGGVLILLAALPFGPPALRRGVVVWGVFAVGMYLVAEALCQAYTTFVPRRAGPLRLLPYYSMALAGLMAGVGAVAAVGSAGLVRRLRPRGGRFGGAPKWAAAAVGAAGSAVLLLALTPVGAGKVALDEAKPLSPEAHVAYSWMRDNLPADSTVLANVYTEGSLGALSGRLGVLDGRLPYLESSEFRSHAIRELLAARRWFTLPQVHRTSLQRDVGYVLVAAPDVDIGGLNNFPVNWDGLRRSRDLRLLRSFADGRLVLFQVEGGRPIAPAAARPRAFIARAGPPALAAERCA